MAGPRFSGKFSSAQHVRFRLFGLLLFLVTFLYTGCNQTYSVKVDGIRDNRYAFPVGTPYVLLMPPRGQVEEGFDYDKAEAMVKTAMATRGYYLVDRLEEAVLVVTVEYGNSPGRVSFRERSTLVNPAMGHTRSGGYRRFPGIVAQTEQQIVPELVSTKYVTFSARDPRRMDSSGKPLEVWNLIVKVEDEGEDFERYLPVLLAAAINYLGENTERQISINMSDSAEAVQYVINDATFEKPPLSATTTSARP